MIFAIGDLHLDHSGQKPMDIFGDRWIGHEKKIVENWKEQVGDEDLVLIPGDVSWGLRLEDAVPDLRLIDSLPGKKLIVKGNHDYWWESMSKLDALSLRSIRFMRNTAENYYNVGIAGTRGWMSRDSEGFDEGDEKIYKRELARLETSILAIDKSCSTRIVMLHYPPFDNKLRPNEFIDIMRKYNVDICIYGHLHAEGHKYSVEGDLEGLTLHLVSSDYLGFKLKPILEVGNENNFD